MNPFFEEIINEFLKDNPSGKKINMSRGFLLSYRLIIFICVGYLVLDHIQQKQFQESDYIFRGKTEFSLFMDSTKISNQGVVNANFLTQIANLNTDVEINKKDIYEIKGRLRMNY